MLYNMIYNINTNYNNGIHYYNHYEVKEEIIISHDRLSHCYDTQYKKNDK